jgi:DNA-binding NtrC family response regulator
MLPNVSPSRLRSAAASALEILRVGSGIDWSRLLSERVAASILTEWATLAPVAVFLRDLTGRAHATFGPQETQGCAGDCDTFATCALATVDTSAPCARDPQLRHLLVPIESAKRGVVALLVTAGWCTAERTGTAPVLHGAVVPVLWRLLVLVAREMARCLDAVDGSKDRAALQAIVGETPAIQEVRREIARIAASERTVLVTGETGTGKELVATAIHQLSRRSAGPFIAMNCAAIPETLLESELFGHERGAFTGAGAHKAGLIEMARGGTLFLDEVSSMSPAVQAKLLRVLETGSFLRVGGVRPSTVDVRFVAATNDDLAALIEAGRFRRDLYYRLNVLRISLPPLRERRADIPLLAGHFIERACREEGLPMKSIQQEATLELAAHDWPGNIRELAHEIERAVLASPASTVRLEDLSPELRTAAAVRENCLPEEGLDAHTQWLAREYLVALLEKHRGRAQAVATEAAVGLRTLYRRLRALGIDPRLFRQSHARTG